MSAKTLTHSVRMSTDLVITKLMKVVILKNVMIIEFVELAVVVVGPWGEAKNTDPVKFK